MFFSFLLFFFLVFTPFRLKILGTGGAVEANLKKREGGKLFASAFKHSAGRKYDDAQKTGKAKGGNTVFSLCPFLTQDGGGLEGKIMAAEIRASQR